MLDTIGETCWRPFTRKMVRALNNGVWSSGIAPGWIPPKDWHVAKAALSGFGDSRFTFPLLHKASGLRAWFNIEGIIKFEVSLPHALFGYNGRLLASPDELDAAWDAVEEILAGISCPVIPRIDLRRLDLVWNFYFEDPGWVLALLKNARWPRVRKDSEFYWEDDVAGMSTATGVRFAGTEMALIIYDKRCQMKRMHGIENAGPSRCLRFEAQLKSRKVIRDVFRMPTSWICVKGDGFCLMYQRLRELVLMLEVPRPGVPKSKIGMDELLAMGEIYHDTVVRHGLLNEIPWKVSPCELYAAGQKPDTVARRRKAVQSVKFELANFSLKEHLPLGAPPAGVNVYRNGRQVAVPTMWHLVPKGWNIPVEDDQSTPAAEFRSNT